MLRITKTIALVLLMSSLANGQSYKQIFEANEIVWFGLDFSKATFVGQFEDG